MSRKLPVLLLAIFVSQYLVTNGRSDRVYGLGQIVEFPLSSTNGDLAFITTGPDGNLWFTEYDGNKIGKVAISP